MEHQNRNVPALDNLELALLESQRLAILPLVYLVGVLHLYHFGALLHEAFVMNGEEIVGSAMLSFVDEFLLGDSDGVHVDLGVSRWKTLKICRVLPWIPVMMVFSLNSGFLRSVWEVIKALPLLHVLIIRGRVRILIVVLNFSLWFLASCLLSLSLSMSTAFFLFVFFCSLSGSLVWIFVLKEFIREVFWA